MYLLVSLLLILIYGILSFVEVLFSYQVSKFLRKPWWSEDRRFGGIFPLRQFPLRQLPTSSIPTLSTYHFVNIDQMEIDKVGINEVGSWQSGNWQINDNVTDDKV